MTAVDGQGVERAQAKLAAAERELSSYLQAVSAAEVGAEAFAAGARPRREAVDSARDELQVELARRPVIPLTGTGADAWQELDAHERNTLLRALLGAVIVKRAGGRGARTPLEDPVRVLAYGTPVRLPKRRGGQASGIVPLPLPDLDDPGVLGTLASKDTRKHPRRAEKMRRRRHDVRLAD